MFLEFFGKILNELGFIVAVQRLSFLVELWKFFTLKKSVRFTCVMYLHTIVYNIGNLYIIFHEPG